MATMRIFEVHSVTLQPMPGEKPSVAVSVQGVAATPGYGNVRLEPLEKKLSADGILDLEFVGDPPDGIVAQVITPVMASMVITKDVDRLVGVKVEARTNAMVELVQTAMTRQAAFGPAGLTPVPGGPIPGGPIPGGPVPGGPVPGGPVPTTAPLFEEIKTVAPFEETKTSASFEEVKTIARFEEGKTFATFEEGKTTAAFEEIKTAAIFEEQKPVFGETDPRVDDPKPPFGEDKPPFGEDFPFRNPFGGR